MGYKQSRGYTRSQLFSYWDRRLPWPQMKAVGTTLDALERFSPTLFEALEDAHVRKVEQPNWKLEEQAVDAVGELLGALQPHPKAKAA